MAAPYEQVVLFGDSLFEACVDVQNGFSFYAAVQKHCSRRYDVVNRGFSGYNTSQALQILEQIFPEPTASGPKMKYLLVLLGANDAALPQEEGNQGLPLEQYKANLQRIITHPRITAHNARVLLITPPPLDEIRTTELDTPKYGHTLRETVRSARYSQAAREVAAAVPGTVLIDLQQALMDTAIANTQGWDASQKSALGSLESGRRGYLEQLLPDGLHLSGEAYQVLWGLVQPELEPQFPNQGTEGYVYPEWRQAPWLKK
ncbi:SGNH hydrolase-type esterase domain-containing protein [Coniella lustricola]|uniref:SGNH hydrolase-type esterase domain-containing protein n=1 Tax=Coniella lustricola TaxID=2025994 RepID=A0A2T3AE72_9PEZI|nr:SGNH hydrolase-type esterase domain-containing protein [Coniella lustricola]